MKIEKIKKTGNKYKITLDNGEVINTFDDVIINNGLLYHKNIDSRILNKINNDTVYYESYNKALNMISRRLRSEFEIKDYLSKKLVDEEDIIKIIDNLKRIGLINDEKYAKAYTNDKINLSMDGPFKIRKHLEENQIKEEYINKALNQIDENILKEHIKKIIEKKIKSNTKNTNYILKQKILNYLINLGYERTMILEELENAKFQNITLETEMQKEYNKLCKKYTENTLYLKLKDKLYRKGFSNEEINNFIETKKAEE